MSDFLPKNCGAALSAAAVCVCVSDRECFYFISLFIVLIDFCISFCVFALHSVARQCWDDDDALCEMSSVGFYAVSVALFPQNVRSQISMDLLFRCKRTLFCFFSLCVRYALQHSARQQRPVKFGDDLSVKIVIHTARRANNFARNELCALFSGVCRVLNARFVCHENERKKIVAFAPARTCGGNFFFLLLFSSKFVVQFSCDVVVAVLWHLETDDVVASFSFSFFHNQRERVNNQRERINREKTTVGWLAGWMAVRTKYISFFLLSVFRHFYFIFISVRTQVARTHENTKSCCFILFLFFDYFFVLFLICLLSFDWLR